MIMTKKTTETAAGAASPAKKPYQKPTFEHERVFETMALSCGKIQTFQGQCKLNTKNS